MHLRMNFWKIEIKSYDIAQHFILCVTLEQNLLLVNMQSTYLIQ